VAFVIWWTPYYVNMIYHMFINPPDEAHEGDVSLKTISVTNLIAVVIQIIQFMVTEWIFYISKTFLF
jgi:NADH:ubiquinone oxidoreductase subunit 2 (subunit N)